MSVIGICGAVLLTVVSSAVIRSLRPEYSVFLSLGAGALLSVVTFASLAPLFEYITDVIGKSAFSEYTVVLLKVIAIGFLTEITAGMCADAGERALSEQVGFFGRGEILLLSLPLIRDALEIAGRIAGQQ
ncbi:MAG: hypothetical protein IKV54_06910 [Clostridia bacterium]|nr:hypothetical protein [Clostridia bacterium]